MRSTQKKNFQKRVELCQNIRLKSNLWNVYSLAFPELLAFLPNLDCLYQHARVLHACLYTCIPLMMYLSSEDCVLITALVHNCECHFFLFQSIICIHDIVYISTLFSLNTDSCQPHIFPYFTNFTVYSPSLLYTSHPLLSILLCGNYY
jgi:hypothetical protein